jgi:hypothetical protein
MVSVSIIRMPLAGNPYFPLFAIYGPWPSSSGLRTWGVVCSGRASRAALTPPCVACSLPSTPRPP